MPDLPNRPLPKTSAADPLAQQQEAIKKPTTRAGVQLSKDPTATKVSHVEDPNEQLFVQLLGQTGLKNAKQATAFWKSVAGLTTKTLIHNQVALLIAIKEAQTQRNMDNYFRRLRIMAFLYLTAVYRKKAHAKELNAAIQKQIDKMLSKNKPSTVKKGASYIPPSLILSQTYLAYQLSAQMIHSALEEKLKEAEALAEELAALEVEHQAILERYAIFEEHLAQLDNDYELFEQRTDGKSTEEKIQDFKVMIASLQQVIDLKQEEIASQIQTDQHDEGKASKMMDELDALNGRSVGMEDILAVLENRKSFYNEEGIEVPSYKTAVHILPKTQRLYIDPQSGLRYLLTVTPGLDAEGLKNRFNDLSSNDKLSAQQHYEQTKPTITNVRHVVASNKTLELTLHHTKVEKALAYSDQLQREILDLNNQAATVASFMDQIANQLDPDMQLPKPRPTPSTSKSAPAKENISKAQIYKHMLQLIKSNPTKDAIDRFADSFRLNDGKPNKEAQDLIRNSIKPGMPIPKTAMDFLLQNLPRFGVTANKPGVTPIPDKTPAKPMSTPQPSRSSQLNPSPAPTPFKTKPY